MLHSKPLRSAIFASQLHRLLSVRLVYKQQESVPLQQHASHVSTVLFGELGEACVFPALNSNRHVLLVFVVEAQLLRLACWMPRAFYAYPLLEAHCVHAFGVLPAGAGVRK